MVATLRQLGAAFRTLLAMTVIVGLLYPLAVWAVGQVAFRDQAAGSLMERDGQIVGSRLIGQSFDGREWFHPRPSAAGEDGYDGLASSGSNLGPNNPELVTLVKLRRAQVAKENGVPPSAVPPDAVTASASGLDPHISPAYAEIQVKRVARERDLSTASVRSLVARHTDGRSLGILGEPGVNVVELNLALAQRAGTGGD
ncbi:potassium-transporting ATPase subunit KdpC [Actinopolymorpha sp. B17G11]|uniref:potassium-transporting ATPase subunit KdpC n=1 Tax=Actinopolymorpha sp. B17G11 TaxID=3160861 RepID=UPI0032E4BE9A